MRVVVIGAGVIGVTTAWYLTREGVDVTVVDKREHAGAGTSFANGGQLSYTFSDALGSPGFVRSLPRFLMNRDIGARASLSPGLIRWGIKLLAQSTRSRADANTLATYRRALRSRELLDALIDESGIEFDHRVAGKMVLLHGRRAIESAQRGIALKASIGSDNVLLDAKEATDIEPALAEFSMPPDACVYSPGDAVGDASQFCRALAAHLQQETSCEFRFGVDVRGLAQTGQRISGVDLDEERIDCDAVVVAAGAASDTLTRPLGVRLPIREMRGYSATLPMGDAAPSVSITAHAERFVFSRLGNRVRIAGFADFSNRSNEQTFAQRTSDLLRTAERVAPQAANYDADQQHHWTGVRPMTPNSQPMLGATKVPGLFLNAGHGMLGWTLACDSGETVSRLLVRSLTR